MGEPVSKDVLADTPLQQVMEQYHDRLHVVASEELRRDALYGVYDVRAIDVGLLGRD